MENFIFQVPLKFRFRRERGSAHERHFSEMRMREPSRAWKGREMAYLLVWTVPWAVRSYETQRWLCLRQAAP